MLFDFLSVLLGFVPKVAEAAIVIAVLIDCAKRLKILPNGYAPLASVVLNLIAYILFYFFGEHSDVIVSVIGVIASTAPVVTALLVSLLSTKLVHDLLVKIGVGYSFPNQEDAG